MPQQIDVPGMGVVEFPDGMSDADITSAIQQNMPKPEASSTVTGGAKSLGVGVGEGLISLAGAPGDLYHMGLRALGDNLTPESSYGSNAIQKGVESVTGEFYKPQGRAEKFLNTAGQYLPAMLGGPETLATKALTRVVAPAVATEVAGALTDDNPYARAGAGVLGAVAAPLAFNRAVKATAPAAAEASLSDIKSAARAGYQHQDVKDVRFAAQPTEDLANNIALDLRGNGFRPNISETGKPVFSLVDELRGASNIDDLDSVRRALGNVAKQRDPVGQLTPNAVAANKAIDHINDFLPNLKQADLLAGDAQKANAILEEARANWGSYKRAQNVQTLAANAELNAAAANSGGNIQNATKQAFKPLLKNNAAKAVGYNAEELAALNNIVRGTWGGSAARTAGNLLGGGGGLGMLAGGAVGYSQGGVPGAIAAGLAGRGLKKIGDRSTLNAVAKLDKLLRSRAPEAIKIAAQNPQITQLLPPASMSRLQALIAADPILSQQVGQPAQANRQ